MLWDGGAGTSLWSDALNWSTNALPNSTDDVQFTGAGGFSINLNGNRTVNSLSFSGSNAYTLTGDTLTVSASAASLSVTSGSHTIASNVTFSNAGVASVGSSSILTLSGTVVGSQSLTKSGVGMLVIGGTATFAQDSTVTGGILRIGNGATSGAFNGNIVNNAAIIFDRSDVHDYTGVISGSGTVTQGGSSTVRLAGANTFTGALTIASGNVAIGAGGSTGSVATTSIVNNGNLIFNRTADYSYGGVISGTGSLFKVNSNTLTLTGTNTYGGVTNLQGGTLVFSALTNLGSGNSIVFDGGALRWASGNTTDISTRTVTINSNGGTFDTNGNDVTLANAFGNSGAGSFTKAGTGTLTILSTPTYTGTTSVTGGTLQIGSGGTSGSISSDIAISSGATVAFNRSGAVTYSGILSGGGNMSWLGSGTLTLTGANTYSGNTSVTAGKLQIGTGGTSGTLPDGNVLLSSGTTLVFNRSDATTFAGTITGAGAVTQNGSSTLRLSGANTFTGTLTITNGSVSIGAGGSTGSVATASIVNAGTLIFNRTADYTYDGAISGSGGLYKVSSNTLTLTGTNTYSGDTHIEGGTLLFSAAANLGSGGTIYFNGGRLKWATGNTTDISSASISLESSGGTLDTNGNDVTLATGLGGTGGLAKAGNGTLTLSTTSVYGGNTSVSGGTLQVGDGGTAGSIPTGTVTVSSGATLAFNRSNAISYAGDIGGAGTLVKSGSGTLTLTGTNTISGGTTVNAGTLQIGSGSTSGSLSGAISVASGATLAFRRSDALSYGGIISGAGSVTNLGGTLTFTGTNSLTGALTISSGTVALGNGGTTGAWSGDIVNNSALSFNRTSNYTLAGDITGTGTATKSGSNTLTLTGTNSITGTLTISSGTVALGSGGTTGAWGGNIVNNSALSFNRTADYTYSGNITGTGTVTKSGSNTLTLSGTNTLTGTLTISSGTVALGSGGTTGAWGGDIVNNSALSFNRTTDYTYDGAISGTGTLTKSGSNTLTLTGTNSYSGATTINAGTVVFNNASALGTGSITVNGGTLKWGSGVTTDLSTRTLTVGASGATFDTNSNNVTLANAFGNSGTGSFTKAGTGTLTLTATPTYTGTTTVSAGTLQIGSGGTSGSLPGNIVNNATLTFNRSDDLGYSGVISGSGGVTKLGTGSLALQGVNTSSGTLTVTAGTVRLSEIYDEGAGEFTSGAWVGNIAIGSSGTFGFATNFGLYTLPGVISGTGAFNVDSGAFVTLTGDNTFTGTTTIAANRFLQIGDGGSTGSLPGNIVNNSLLNFARSNTHTYAGVISGSGELQKFGAGTLIFTGANSYSGVTTVIEGKLQIGAGGTSGTLPDGDVLLNPGTTLVFNRSDATTFAGTITSTGSVTQNGSNTLRLSGANTFTGTLTITSGSVSIGAGGSTGSVATASIVNAGTLIFNRTTDYTYDGVISGAGTVTKSGSNTLTLTGTNSYTGATTISAGTLMIENAGALGTGSITINGGTLKWGSNAISDLSARITIGASGATFDTNGGNVTFATGLGASTGGLTKTGSGTLELSGTCTYSGGTTVAGGTLLVTGSISGATTVQSGGTLRGTGSVSGVTVQSGGTLAPGVIVGTMNSGALAFSSGATLSLDLNGTGTSSYDRLNVTGSVALGSAALSLSITATLPEGSILFPILNDGSDAISGTFLGLADDSTFTVSGTSFQISYDGNSSTGLASGGNDLALIVIPEPANAALLLAGLGALLGKRRTPGDTKRGRHFFHRNRPNS